MTALDFGTQRPRLLVDADVDSTPLREDPVEVAAGVVLPGFSLVEAADTAERTLYELLGALEAHGELVEGVYWNPDMHPRWPEGTPGGLGGQFMHSGQRFSLKGVEYDIDKVLPGKVYAHVATHGVKAKPQTVEFSASELAKAERPPAEAIKGAKSDTLHMSATVIDPYVHSETHDPSIPVPANSAITPEQWARFGKQDQEWYSALQERFGTWTAGSAQKKVDAVMQAGDQASQAVLASSYSSQFGSSTGFTISLHGLFKGLMDKVKGSPTVEATRQKYEKARGLQADAAAVLQWDLYNRTRGPDIAIFHKHSTHPLFQHEIIEGNKPVFAGLSQSQWWRPAFFGPYTFATPMAIRHIVMSTVSADVTHYGGFNSEQEVATADPFLADDRSLEAQSFTAMQSKWLTSITSNGKSAPGSIIAMLKDSMKDGGVNLPVLPSDPMIQMAGAGGHGWVSPPKDATEYALVGNSKVSVLDLPYANVEDGKPVAKKMKDMVESGEIQAGDYIEGMQGTRYIVLPDPTDPYLHLAYYKITDTGKAVPDTAISVGGQQSSAYAGHSLWQGGEEAYTFEGGGEKAWKKLAGHYQLITQSKEKTGFYPEAWAVGGPDDIKWMKDFKPGEKFMVAGTAYQVEGDLAGGNKKIKDLSTGKTGQINGDTKLPPLLLKAGYTETGEAQLDPADFLKGAPAKLSSFDVATKPLVLYNDGLIYRLDASSPGAVAATQMSGTAIGKQQSLPPDAMAVPLQTKPPGWEQPQVGDTFAYDGQRATVTKLLKDGKVQAKKQGGGVVKLEPSDSALAYLHRPASYELGDKTKLKLLAVGEKFHGGTGTQHVRPYVVVGQGKTTTVRNLDTGEQLEMSANKSFPRLVLKQTPAAAPVFDHTQPQSPQAYDPDAWQPGPKKLIGDLAEGDKFVAVGAHGAVPYELVSKGTDAHGQAKNLMTGHTSSVKLTFPTPVETLVPKTADPEPEPEAVPAAPSGVWEQAGPDVTLGDLEPGDQFKMNVGKVATVWEVTGPAENGVVPLLVVSSPQGDVVGSTPATPASFKSSNWQIKKKATAGPAEGLAPNTLSLLQLPIGAHVQMHAKPDDPSIATAAVLRLDKFEGGTATLSFVTPATGKDGKTVAPTTSSIALPTDTVFDYAGVPAPQPQAAAPKPSAPAVSGPSFDPSAYNEVVGMDGQVAKFKLNQLQPGDVFRGKTGKHFQIDKISGANVYATNLATGKKTKLASSIEAAAALVPKSESKTPYDKLQAGDPVAVGDLKQGDQFELNGYVYQVTDPSAGIDEKNPTIAVVKPGGQLGVASSHAVGPNAVVKLHAKKADTLLLPDHQVEAMATDPADLEDAYVAGKLTGTYHDNPDGAAQVETLAPGVVFEDAKGAQFKVKQAGTQPIITDGEKLYTVSGGTWVVPKSDLGLAAQQFVDATPDPVDTHQEVEKQLALDAMKDASDMTLTELELQPGDTFAVSAGGKVKVMKVTSTGSSGMVFAVSDTGGNHQFLPGYVPNAYAKAETMEGLILDDEPSPLEAAIPSVPQPNADEMPATPLPNVLPLSQLAVGTHFKKYAESDMVWEIVGKAKNGKTVNAKLVKLNPDAGDKLPVGTVQKWDGVDVTPALIGSPGAFDAETPFAPFSSSPADYEKTGQGLASAAEPGAFVKGATGVMVYQVVRVKEGSDPPLVTLQTPEGMHFDVAGMTPLEFLAPNGSADATTTANISSIADMPDPGEDDGFGLPYVKPSEVKVGDHIVAGNGKEFEVTGVGAAKSGSASVTLKDVMSGVEGGGYYSDETTKDWALLPHPDSPSQIVGTYAEPGEPINLGDVEVGATVKQSGWNGAVYRVIENPGGAGYHQIKVQVVKPQSSYGPQKTGDQKIVGSGQLVVPYAGGPMWRVGEFAKLVKPGNVSGQTVRVVGHDAEQLVVRRANGKEMTVPPLWLQGMSKPQWATKEKLAFEKTPVGELKPGDIFALADYYGGSAAVVDEVHPDGGVTAHHWGKKPDSYAYAIEKPAGTQVEVLITKRQQQAVSFAKETPKAVPATPETPNGTAAPYAALAVGQKVSYKGAIGYVAYKDAYGITISSEPGGFGYTSATKALWKKHGSLLPADGTELTQNTAGKSFLELGLGPGDKVGAINGGTETVTKVYGEPGTNGHVYDTVHDQTGASATYGTGGTPDSYWKAGGKPVKLGELKLGDVFELPQNPDSQQQWLVTKLPESSDAPFVWAKEWGGDGKALPFGAELAATLVSSAAAAEPAHQFDPADWQNGPTKDMVDLEVGDKFVTTTNGPPEYYELASKAGGVVHFVSLTPAGSDYVASPAGKVAMIVPKQPTEDDVAAKLKAGLAAVLGHPDLDAEAQKRPLGALKPGEHFHVGETHGSPEGDYEVLPGEPYKDWDPGKDIGWKKAPSHIVNPVYGLNLKTGSATWFGDQLAVTPLPPAAPPVGVGGAKTPGELITSVDALAAGDFFVTPAGNVYRVDSAQPAGGQVVMSVTVVKVGVGFLDDQVGKQYPMGMSDGALASADWKWYPPVEEKTPGAAGAAVGPLPDVLSPYLWPKSGKKKFPKISSLAAGASFKDKQHKAFTVKGPGAGGLVHYTDASGQEYATSGDSRVFVG